MQSSTPSSTNPHSLPPETAANDENDEPDLSQILSHTDWDELSTPAPLIRHRKRPTTFALSTACTRNLRSLTATLGHREATTEGLALLVAGIREMIAQKWKVLLLHFNPDAVRRGEQQHAPPATRGGHVEWRKWEVVRFLTDMAVSYGAACEEAREKGEVLCTEEVDVEMLGLVKDVLDLGAAVDGGVIVIREWERVGTMRTLDARGVCASGQ